jgi:hypothetical protein
MPDQLFAIEDVAFTDKIANRLRYFDRLREYRKPENCIEPVCVLIETPVGSFLST